MGDSMHQYMQQDIECERLLECLHGLKSLDVECFLLLTETREGLTVDEIAEHVQRERTTAYRSVQRLLEHGLIEKEQVNYEQGSYYYLYKPKETTEIAGEMQRMLNDWYAKMDELIGEFRVSYDADDSEERL
ncbi:helix-turn-helix domain-containing protein [Haladaptatus sp. NG-SE-30]